MKYNVEIDPQEIEVLCNCVVSIFKIYADVETQSKTNDMARFMAEKIDHVEKQVKQLKDLTIEKELQEAFSKKDEKKTTVVKAPAKKAVKSFKEVDDDDEYI